MSVTSLIATATVVFVHVATCYKSTLVQACQFLLGFVECFLKQLTNVYCTLQKVDILLSARAKVLIGFSFK